MRYLKSVSDNLKKNWPITRAKSKEYPRINKTWRINYSKIISFIVITIITLRVVREVEVKVYSSSQVVFKTHNRSYLIIESSWG